MSGENKNRVTWEFKELLSKEETISYIFSAQNGDEDAENKLIMHNTRLVRKIAREASNNSSILDMDDLIAAGTIGLLSAIRNFDVNKNVEFPNYASLCIKREIFRELKRYKNIEFISSLDEEKEDEENYYYYLVSEDDVENEYFTKELYDILRESLNVLTHRQREVIKLRYPFDGTEPLTLREVGEIFNCWYSNVRVIEKTARKNMRKYMETRGIDIQEMYVSERNKSKPLLTK